MKSLLRILTAIFFTMTLANCAMLGLSGDDEKPSDETEESTMSDSDEESMDTGSSSEDSFVSGSDDDSSTSSETSVDSSENSGSEILSGGDQSDPSSNDSSVSDNSMINSDSTSERAEASAPFKDGMYIFSTDCTMRADPEENAASEGTVRSGKELWVEGYDSKWVKVFKKAGPVFVDRNCI